MKKHLFRGLFILNILIVVSLFIMSACVILAARNNGILGYSCSIVKRDAGNSYFVVVEENNRLLTQGDLFLTRVNGTSTICRVQDVDENIVTYKNIVADESGEIDVTSSNYIGRIRFSSEFIGNALAYLSTSGTSSLMLVLIIGICGLSLVFLVIVYMIHIKKTAIVSQVDDIAIPHTDFTTECIDTKQFHEIVAPILSESDALPSSALCVDTLPDPEKYDDMSVDNILEDIDRKYHIL